MARERAVVSGLPLRAVVPDPERPLDPSQWPLTVPAVAEFAASGLELGPATVLVGENGSGKSTVIEAIAMAFGLNPEGGSTHARYGTRSTESPLHEAIRVSRGAGGSRWGFFLRAETMHGLYTYLEGLDGARGPRLHEMSHGESFLALLESRFDSPGLYLLDEPESALSFSGCLALVGALHGLIGSGRAQVIVATHSPVVAALPGATILEFSDRGIEPVPWDELDLVDHHRRFLADPQRYLRHVID